jgi:hypothetical protein
VPQFTFTVIGLELPLRRGERFFFDRLASVFEDRFAERCVERLVFA